VSRPFIRPAVAALAAVGLALSSGALPERGASAAIEVGADITLAFEPGCDGSGTYEVVNETKGVVQNRQATTWSASKPILVEDGSGGVADRGDRLVVRLLDDDGRLLFTAPVPFLDDIIVNQYHLPDYLLLVQLDCTRVPYEVSHHLSYNLSRRLEPEEPRGRAAQPPAGISAAITLAFEPGCGGSGTYEVVNETKGVVQNRQATTWSASKPILVEDGSGGVADRGDRLVVRLLDADGRLLFTAPVPFLDDIIVNQYRLPDYLLLARLDCARVPYEVTYHLSYDTPPSPPTSTTAPGVDGDLRWPPAVLGLLFGLALVASSAYAARRDRHRVDRRGRTVPSPHTAGDGR